MRTATLAEAALPKLVDALSENTLRRQAERPGDQDHLNRILADINGLLGKAGTLVELGQECLGDANLLRSHLVTSLQVPAQALATKLPMTLERWVNAEPGQNQANRPAWAKKGQALLAQVRLGWETNSNEPQGGKY